MVPLTQCHVHWHAVLNCKNATGGVSVCAKPLPLARACCRSRDTPFSLSRPLTQASAASTQSQRYSRGLPCWQDSTADSAISATSTCTASMLLAASTMCHVASLTSSNLCATVFCISSCPAERICQSRLHPDMHGHPSTLHGWVLLHSPLMQCIWTNFHTWPSGTMQSCRPFGASE